MNVHRALPARPFRVVTTTTPFDAFVPYNVAADGPFTISMSSISSGLSELSIENDVWPFSDVVPASKRIPSTIQIGALVRLIDERPRMRIVGAPPVITAGSTTTPGALATTRSP